MSFREVGAGPRQGVNKLPMGARNRYLRDLSDRASPSCPQGKLCIELATILSSGWTRKAARQSQDIGTPLIQNSSLMMSRSVTRHHWHGSRKKEDTYRI